MNNSETLVRHLKKNNQNILEDETDSKRGLFFNQYILLCPIII